MKNFTLLKKIAIFGVCVLLIIIGIIAKDIYFIRQTATYGNFDVPNTESWVIKLKPGIGDYASNIVYDKFHPTPLKTIGWLFAIVLFLSLYKNKKDLILRKLSQWSFFVASRLGVLRVAGINPVKRTFFGCFPFLNCQACEMATGACPIGMIQWSIIKGKIPYFVLGVIIASGALLGRAVCGWMCPFGFISDILEKISFKKIKLWEKLKYLKFIFLFLIFTFPLFSIPIFCIYFCASGKIFGLLPYYLTTGLEEFKVAFSNPVFLKTILGFHLFTFSFIIIGAILIVGRWFCKYLCPLGAFYGLFNDISPIKIIHNPQKCVNCGLCKKKCPMEIDLAKNNFSETVDCLKCGRCVKLCKARSFKFKFLTK